VAFEMHLSRNKEPDEERKAVFGDSPNSSQNWYILAEIGMFPVLSIL
jgi:hypothetical protein